MTLNDIIHRVKAKLLPQIPDEDFAPMVAQQMFPAIEELARTCASNSSLRHYFLTSPSSVTATLDADGVADLSSLITTNKIILDCLKYGEIYPPVSDLYSTQPFKLIEGEGQGKLSGMLDSLIQKAWIEGTSLKTKSPDNNITPMTGTITFRVPFIPDLDEIQSPLEGMLADILVRRLGGINAGREVDASEGTED